VTVEMVTLCVGRIPSCQKRLLFINAQWIINIVSISSAPWSNWKLS
jgi:hypothetical protein